MMKSMISKESEKRTRRKKRTASLVSLYESRMIEKEQSAMRNEKEHGISDSDKLKRCPRNDTHPFLPLPNVTEEQETGSHRRFEAVFFQARRLYVGLHSKS